jgi:nucleotide-binding universal stress UspA family protein
MIEIRRILCPVDFSDFSRHAFDHAVAVASWYESTVVVFHVSAPAPFLMYAPGPIAIPATILTPEGRDCVLSSMRAFAEPQHGAGGVPLEFDVSEGNAATEILANAAATPTDLIVMGTHGRSGFERLLLGSVTEKVLRRAACPVLSVPPHAAGTGAATPVSYKRILCGVDFSDCSMHALNYAMSLAQEADAQLTVLHVVEVPVEAPTDFHERASPVPLTLAEYVTAAETARRERLEQLVPDAVRAFCTVETLLTTGKPYREILRVASEQHSDLIVVGVHGPRAVDLRFFGSTAQHVVRAAACPVLTLKLTSTK